MAEKEYRRLTRWRGRRKGWITIGFVTRSSLWLGKDHLLKIDSNRFVETYKRFYFRDIQAITIRTTRRRQFWNIILLLLMLVCIGSLSGIFVRRFMLVTMLVLAVPMLVNNLLGTTCVTFLRTAVQVEELPSLSRVRRVHKVLQHIRPLIAGAQGELTPEEISAGMQEMTRTAAIERQQGVL